MYSTTVVYIMKLKALNSTHSYSITSYPLWVLLGRTTATNINAHNG